MHRVQAVRHRVPLRSHPSRWHVYRRCRPHCVAACPTKALTVMGGAADRELDVAKRLRSIENGPAVDVTAVAQGLSEKAEGSENNG